MRYANRNRLNPSAHSGAEDEDPLAGLANLFDVSVAFIVALLIALTTLFSSSDMLDPNSKSTMVKTNSKGEVEIVTKERDKITVQKVTDKTLSGQGTRLGVAYELSDGQVVYVPEGEAPPQNAVD